MTLATPFSRDSGHLCAIEAQSGHAYLGHHGEIGAPPHVAGEIATRARGPPVVVLRKRDCEEAVDRILVDVADRADSARRGSALDGGHEARPFLDRRAADLVWPRPHLAVITILIAFKPAITAHDIAP